MSQYFQDEKGQYHEFPDDVTPEEIDMAMSAVQAAPAKPDWNAEVAKYQGEADAQRDAVDALGGPVVGPLKVAGMAFGAAGDQTLRGIKQFGVEAIGNLAGDSTGLTSGDNPVTRWAGRASENLRQEEASAREDQALVNERIPGFNRQVTGSKIAQVLPAAFAAPSALGAIGVGTAIGATEPLTPEESRAGSTATGAAFGVGGVLLPRALTRFAARGLSERISPAVKEMYDRVTKQGIQPTVNNLLEPGASRSFVEFMQQLPFAGGAKAINRELAEFTSAVGKKFGVNSTELTEAVMKQADDTLWQQRQQLLGNKMIDLDVDLGKEIGQILRNAPSSIDAPQIKILTNNIERLVDAGGNSGQITGEMYTNLRRVLQENAKTAGRAGVSDHILALRKALDNAAIRSLGRTNKDVAEELVALNRATSNFMVAREAIEGSTAMPGIITPTRLRTVTKPASAPGSPPRSTRDMRDLAKAASSITVGKKQLDPQGINMVLSAIARPLVTLGTAGIGGGVVGRGLNNRAASRWLAEGMKNPQTRSLIELLGLSVAPAAQKAKVEANKGGGR